MPRKNDEIPSIVEILGEELSVSIVGNGNELEIEWDDEDLGQFDSKQGEISLRGGMTGPVTAEILFHEIGHKLFESTGGYGRRLTEEDFCQLFALGCVQIFRYNPGLAEWACAAVRDFKK